ncbi:MAG: adenosylcobinamide-GDP ribazoletransferase [Paenirhodobacter sp.]|uniref:adenosylcobinamide-GDP ribazoletransferase n=1 Tax=Paenirhodobacter sp. TaxID=1965326 RepID=UPI003D0AE9C3
MIARLRHRLAEAQLALMLLSRLPAGRLPEPAPGIAAAIWAFPLAGALLGLIAGGVLSAGLALGLPLPLAAGLALVAQIMASGALHEDGLADLADGLWGGRDRARRLEIMRDSRIGSYGVLALLLGVGLRWQALSLASGAGAGAATAALVALGASSRLAPALLLATLPPARSDGMGRRASGVTPGGLFVALLLALAVLIPLQGSTAIGILALQALLTLGLGLLALRRLGGQTGDVLGAGQQLAEIGGWLVICATIAR